MDYLKFAEYPQAIRETSDALMDVKRDLRRVESDKKYRAAYIERFEKLEGSNAEQRKADLVIKIHNDPEYSGLCLREQELQLTRERLEADLYLLRDQFTVLKLQTQEKIALVSDRDSTSATPF